MCRQSDNLDLAARSEPSHRDGLASRRFNLNPRHAARTRPPGLLDALRTALRSLVSRIDHQRHHPDLTQLDGERDAPRPVSMGVSHPRSYKLERPFVCRFFIHDDQHALDVQSMVARLDPTAKVHGELRRLVLAKGAPVRVQVTSASATVKPAIQQFSWDGHYNVTDFEIRPKRSKICIVLHFQVAVGDTPVTSIAIQISSARQPNHESTSKCVTFPRSAFACYASHIPPVQILSSRIFGRAGVQNTVAATPR